MRQGLRMNLESTNFVNEGRTLKRYLDLKTRPPPVRVPRKRMDLQFAVQLMRNSYNAMDTLDFTPTDLFQKNQFLFRQNEWEMYKKEHPNVLQGDLANPEYFDFISWVQFSTLNFCMNEASVDPFIEVIGSEAISQKVEPIPLLDSKEKIKAVHSSVTGDGVLDFILSTYPKDIIPEGVPLSGSSQTVPGGRVVGTDTKGTVEQFLEAAALLLDIFAINSFLLEPRMKAVPQEKNKGEGGGSIISLEQTLPANLWSLQTLRLRKEVPNDFVIMVLQALARRMGLSLGNPLSVNLLPNNISLLSVMQLKGSDEGYNRLLSRVYVDASCLAFFDSSYLYAPSLPPAFLSCYNPHSNHHSTSSPTPCTYTYTENRYDTRRARNAAVKDSPIVTNIKRGESPLPPQVQ